MNPQAQEIRRRLPNLQSITAMFADSNGIMRGKIIPAKGLEKLLEEGLFLPASVFGTDATGESVAETGLVWQSGDKDYPWRIIPDSFFALPNSDGTAAAVLVQMIETDGVTPHHLDPRGILAQVIARINAKGIFPVIAPELEFYLIAQDNDAMGMGKPATVEGFARPQQTQQIYGIDAYDEFAPIIAAVCGACQAVSVAADTALAEYGRGQFEINITHNSAILRACDEAALLRYLARRVVRGLGYDATFMGKPFADDTGSGFHLHASLWDGEGGNVLSEKDGQKPWENPKMAFAAGGLAAFLADSMAIFAPNANAWRRLQPGHYAPTDRSWGYNNRTVNFRIPPSGAEARRLEHRASSADVNPYLATACILAAMTDGIEGRIPPPPITHANAYDAPNRDGLPRGWGEALGLFESSDFIARWLGAEYRHIYSQTKHYERRVFMRHITPLEWAWYR